MGTIFIQTIAPREEEVRDSIVGPSACHFPASLARMLHLSEIRHLTTLLHLKMHMKVAKI